MNIAYIWQRSDIDMTRDTGPVLHVKAVIRQLLRRNHQVRLFVEQAQGAAVSGDLEQWQSLPPRSTNAPWFRAPESAVRGVQSRLNLPYARLVDSLRFADAILPALAGVDIVYERHDLQATGGLMAARRLKIPHILELNGDILREYDVLGIPLSRSQRAVVRRVTRRSYHLASHIVTVSQPLRLSTIADWNLPPDRVTAVPNGVDLDLFADQRNGHNPEQLPGPHAPTIIHVGSFQPWHSVDLLVDAFSLVVEQVPEARLVLVGDGDLRTDIEARVASLALGSSVQFTGSVSHQQVAEWLARADVAILAHKPSKEAGAGTPLKLLEYMAASMAIVAPDLPNISAIVQNGESAILFDPGNATDLSRSIHLALGDSDLRNRIGRAARRNAISSYSWEAAVRGLEQIFTDVANQGQL